MKAIFINIAVDKAGAAEQREALPALREVVAAYETAVVSFGERINASKTKRGEAPTKQTQLAAFIERFPDAGVEERA